jgi:hypothetical protein
MQNAKKLPDPEPDKISVYSFAGSVIIPTEQGAYWANAVGGVIESRPVGNPFILFALKYIWGLGGEISEFPEPLRIRLNTAMAVTETFDFKFPPPEVPADDPLLLQARILAEEMANGGDEDDEEGDEIEGDEAEEFDEDQEFDEDENVAEEVEEVEDELSQVLHSDNEISW